VYSGINVLDRREEMNFSQTRTQQLQNITSKEIVKIHPLLPPTRITIYDTTFTDISTTETINRKNRYRYVSIPVGLRFSGYKKRLGLHLSADAAVQVITSYSGTILAPGSLEQDLSSSNFKRSKIGGSVSTAFGVSYLMKPRFTLMVEPRATYFMTPINSNSYGINQRDYSYGLLIGLKYHL
jgi:hypothetical protein